MEKYLVLHRLTHKKTPFLFSFSHTIIPELLEHSEGDEVQTVLYEGMDVVGISHDYNPNRLPFDTSSISFPAPDGSMLQNYLDFHVHDHYQITLCTSGQIDYIINTEKISMSKNDILCINLSVPHTWYSQAHTKCLHLGYYPNSLNMNSFCARFTPYTNLLYSQYRPYLLITPDAPLHPIIFQILCEIENLNSQQPPGYDALIHNRIVDASIYLASFCASTNGALSVNDIGTETIQKAIQFINKHYREPINVNSVSQYVGMNSNYFSHYFKAEMGLSCKKYINLKRIEYATALLSMPDCDIMQVAFGAGFSSLSAFYKCFSDNYHIPPAKYRQIITNKHPLTTPPSVS